MYEDAVRVRKKTKKRELQSTPKISQVDAAKLPLCHYLSNHLYFFFFLSISLSPLQVPAEDVWHLCTPDMLLLSFTKREVARWISGRRWWQQRRRRNNLGSGPGLFTDQADYFEAPPRCCCCCRCRELSCERVIWKHSQVSRSLFLTTTRLHHQYNRVSGLSLSSEETI